MSALADQLRGDTADVDLLYDETQEDLRASVRGLLAARCAWPEVLARSTGPEPYDLSLWRALAGELGLAGLAVPEAYGGAGASLREAAVVLEELGRAVAPVPYLGSAVVATRALLCCGETDLLTRLASGSATAALAVPFSAGPLAPAVTVVSDAAVPTGAEGAVLTGAESTVPTGAEGAVLTGAVTSVADALPADVLLVHADGGLFAVEAAGPGVTRAPVVSLDATRQLCDLTLTAAPGRLIAPAAQAGTAVTAALTAGAALLAAEQVGVAQWCLDTTVEYAKTRRQFGRPIGSFQAIKHRLADVWVAVTEARAVARYAAACAELDDPRAPIAAALAQAHCGPVAVFAAQECVQLHGGIGFTWEHPAHLYLKRAKSASIAFGSADSHRQTLAELVDLPPAR
jgi:alkylation response protein AidB-like acyl-CoA dehydrogenase